MRSDDAFESRTRYGTEETQQAAEHWCPVWPIKPRQQRARLKARPWIIVIAWLLGGADDVCLRQFGCFKDVSV